MIVGVIRLQPMQRVISLGGPLVLLPSSDVARWIYEFGDSPTPDSGLYKMACSVERYCGIITPWDTPLIIFGDEPADTYYTQQMGFHLFFRWIGAESIEQLSEFALNVARTDKWDETMTIDITTPAMTLMDTCSNDLSPRINVSLQPGPYTMQSCYSTTSGVMAIVHKLENAG